MLPALFQDKSSKRCSRTDPRDSSWKPEGLDVMSMRLWAMEVAVVDRLTLRGTRTYPLPLKLKGMLFASSKPRFTLESGEGCTSFLLTRVCLFKQTHLIPLVYLAFLSGKEVCGEFWSSAVESSL